MPHIVFDWDRNIQDLLSPFQSISEETVNWRIFIRDIYTEICGKKAIVPVRVVEEGHVQNFYALIDKSDQKHTVTIRLDPSTDPVKTKGVKRSLALLAEKIKEWNIHISLNRHNLQDILHL